MQAAENPRAVIGGNQPPEPTAIELAAEPVEALRMFLAVNPVILIEDEARDAHNVYSRVTAALKSVEAERKSLVDPLNAEVKAINARYHHLHNADDKRPGLWDKRLSELKSRMTTYAIEQERKRHEAENAVSLRDHETLHVTDCMAAIQALSDDDGNIPQDVADAILKCARAYRKEHRCLPAGVAATYERGLR